MPNYAAFGTLLKIGNGGGPETFTTIAGVTNISGPGIALDPVEVTNHSSTGGWREFVGGLKDGGEITLDLNFDPAAATHDVDTGLLDDLDDRTVRNFQLVFPDTGASTWSFSALVTNFEPAAPIDGALTASVSLKLTGQPTLT